MAIHSSQTQLGTLIFLVLCNWLLLLSDINLCQGDTESDGRCKVISCHVIVHNRLSLSAQRQGANFYAPSRKGKDTQKARGNDRIVKYHRQCLLYLYMDISGVF